MARDGKHYPTKEFKENFDDIFRKNKIHIRNKTTKQFLESLNGKEKSSETK
mgnify:CR=1 FL=1